VGLVGDGGGAVTSVAKSSGYVDNDVQGQGYKYSEDSEDVGACIAVV